MNSLAISLIHWNLLIDQYIGKKYLQMLYYDKYSPEANCRGPNISIY